MKKFFIAGLIALTFVTSAFASGTQTAGSKAAAHLEANYASAKDVTWTYSETLQKASITLGNEKMEVYYDEFGALIGSTKTMAFDKLPKAALEKLTTEYTFPEFQLKDCIAFTDAGDNTSFYVSFDTVDGTAMLSISKEGKIALMQQQD